MIKKVTVSSNNFSFLPKIFMDFNKWKYNNYLNLFIGSFVESSILGFVICLVALFKELFNSNVDFIMYVLLSFFSSVCIMLPILFINLRQKYRLFRTFNINKTKIFNKKK